jgi:NADPH-dependent 2,4-dienoyl-CoA reductase/sulfur reductase-like enzyme
MPTEYYDLVIIGAGPAGLAAAAAAVEQGCASVLLLERDAFAGGVLNQCIHDGFGLHRFGQSLSGPEYASRFISFLPAQVTLKTGCMVLSIDEQLRVVASSGNACSTFRPRPLFWQRDAASVPRERSLCREPAPPEYLLPEPRNV